VCFLHVFTVFGIGAFPLGPLKSGEGLYHFFVLEPRKTLFLSAARLLLSATRHEKKRKEYMCV
jgi:hypothetical protein